VRRARIAAFALALGALSALALGALVALAPAAQAKTFAGMIPDVPTGTHLPPPLLAHVANVPYGGGEVLHSNRTHLIFWAPAGSGLTFDPGYESLIETFLKNVAAASHSPTNVYGLTGQYTDSGGPAAYNSVYGGAVLATDRSPANGCVEPPLTGPGWSVCLTDSQLEAEIEHVVSADRLPTTGTDIYFLLTPDGLGDCEDGTSTSCALGGSDNGYCGYHSATPDGRILYAVIPYNAISGHCQSDNPRPNSSTADPTLSTLSHEHAETITDPMGDAWIDGSGNEIADLCITDYGPRLGGSLSGIWDESINGGRYYLQELWSNEDGGCEPRAKPDRASFTFTSGVTAGKPLSFTARASDPDGSIVGYAWFFGDGRTGSGRRSSHTFARAGTYRVVLRTTDSADNWAFYALNVGIGKARDMRRAHDRGRRT
jgi:PKD domain-containing protein